LPLAKCRRPSSPAFCGRCLPIYLRSRRRRPLPHERLGLRGCQHDEEGPHGRTRHAPDREAGGPRGRCSSRRHQARRAGP
jgi:hypothetical protein